MKTEQIFEKIDELRKKRDYAKRRYELAYDKANEWDDKVDELNKEIQNLATDLWGGAGPDCKVVQQEAA